MSSVDRSAEEEVTTRAAAELAETETASSPLPEKTSQSSSSGEQRSFPEVPPFSVNEVSMDITAAVTPPRSL